MCVRLLLLSVPFNNLPSTHVWTKSKYQNQLFVGSVLSEKSWRGSNHTEQRKSNYISPGIEPNPNYSAFHLGLCPPFFFFFFLFSSHRIQETQKDCLQVIKHMLSLQPTLSQPIFISQLKYPWNQISQFPILRPEVLTKRGRTLPNNWVLLIKFDNPKRGKKNKTNTSQQKTKRLQTILNSGTSTKVFQIMVIR